MAIVSQKKNRGLVKSLATLVAVLCILLCWGPPRSLGQQTVVVGNNSVKKAVMLLPRLGSKPPKGDDLGRTYRSVRELLHSAGYSDADIDVKQNQQVDLDCLKHLSKYSVIFIDTHGDYYSWLGGWRDVYFMTGIKCTYELIRENFKDFDDRLLVGSSILEPNAPEYVMVSSHYLAKYNGNFPNSLFYAYACYGMTGGYLGRSLGPKGVQAVAGFDRTCRAGWWYNPDDLNWEENASASELAAKDCSGPDDREMYDFFQEAVQPNKSVKDAYFTAYNSDQGRNPKNMDQLVGPPCAKWLLYLKDDAANLVLNPGGTLPEVPDTADREKCIEVIKQAEDNHWQREYSNSTEKKPVEYEIILQSYDGQTAKAMIHYKDGKRASSIYVVEKKNGLWVVTDNYSTAD